jgi:nitroreductase
MSLEESTKIFTEIPEIHYHEEVPEVRSEDFANLVRSRRSIRVFDGTPIPEEVVNACLDLALLAPNSSNLQAWEFYWVRSPEKKAALVKACFSQPAARTAAEQIVCVARTATWKKNAREMLRIFSEMEARGEKVPAAAKQYYSKLAPFIYSQGWFGLWGLVKSGLYFMRGFFGPTPREPVSLNDMKIWAVKSASLAAENLMLAFRSHGFDTCPLEGYDSAKVRKLLRLPSDAQVVMVISAGKRSNNGVYGPRIRFKRDWFVKEV